MRHTIAVAILAGSLALGSGVAAASDTHTPSIARDNRPTYITTGPADRCQSFADDANRALSDGNNAQAQQIVDSAAATDCTLVLVTL